MTKKPTTIHGRKLVLTRLEQQTWDNDQQYYLDLGYPIEIASQYAWDHYQCKGQLV